MISLFYFFILSSHKKCETAGSGYFPRRGASDPPAEQDLAVGVETAEEIIFVTEIGKAARGDTSHLG